MLRAWRPPRSTCTVSVLFGKTLILVTRLLTRFLPFSSPFSPLHSGPDVEKGPGQHVEPPELGAAGVRRRGEGGAGQRVAAVGGAKRGCVTNRVAFFSHKFFLFFCFWEICKPQKIR
jgi:hypothetical protein